MTSIAGQETWERVFGHELREGDVIKTWFSEGHDRIVHLSPYVGRLAGIFSEGAQTAAFALNKTGMTIENGALYDRAAAKTGGA